MIQASTNATEQMILLATSTNHQKHAEKHKKRTIGIGIGSGVGLGREKPIIADTSSLPDLNNTNLYGIPPPPSPALRS